MSSSKRRISASFLGTLARCGMQAYFSFVERIFQPPGVALVVGKAVHASAAADLTNKIEHGQLLFTDHVLDRAATIFDAEWEGEEPELTEEERSEGRQAVRGRAKDEAIALSCLHHDDVAPKLDPIGVERRFDIEIRGFPLDLSGYRDVDEPACTRDIKTAGKTPAATAAENSVQLEVYALSRKVFDGKEVSTVALDYLVKTKKPKAVTVTAAAPSDFAPLFQRIEAAAKVIETGAFYPTDPDSWVCSKRFCGYWQDHCPYGRRRRVQV